MTRAGLALCLPLLLAACAPGPIQGTKDSGANTLSVGQSRADVEARLGAFQETHPLPDGTLCVSFLYDEVIAPRFTHAVFADGALVRASDGHRTTCSGA